MPLRRRLSIIAAASVGIAILLASAVCYLVVRHQLQGQIDDSLRAQKQAIESHQLGLDAKLPTISASAGGPAQYQQVVLYNGHVGDRLGNIALPVDSTTLAVAQGKAQMYVTDIQEGRNHLRMIVFHVPVVIGVNGPIEPAAVELARPLNTVDSILSSLRLVLLFVLIGGVIVAGTLGRIASRRVLKPLKQVERTAQRIAETDDLSTRINVHTDDEVGRLASRFDQMLDRLQRSRDALDQSVRAQRQLVADASHELRTPVTSLRTNIEILLADRRSRRRRAPRDADRRGRAVRGARLARQRPDRARPRRSSRAPRPRTCALTGSPTSRWRAPSATRRTCVSRRRSSRR